MQNNSYRRSTRRSQRGQALVIALSLVVCLIVLTAATQIQVVSQLGASRRERDYERALQMAEAGANAYLNELSSGFVNAKYAYMPPLKALNSNANGDVFPISVSSLKQRVQAGTYAITKYPANSQQGFFVGHTASSASGVTIVSYGWSNGVVRRIQVGASSVSLFDLGAVYGLNPATTGNNYCWKFNGSANVVGGGGGEGAFVNSNNATWYDGPALWAGPGAASNPFPAIQTSSDNVPTGHVGTGTCSGAHTRCGSTMNIPTADQAANACALKYNNVSTTRGVEYYRNNNDNDTGIRYLVQHSTTGVIRELPGCYSVMDCDDYELDTEFQPKKSTLTNLGMTSKESFCGLRFHPGNYFFEQVSMQNTDKMFLRTFNDAERSTISGRGCTVSGDPPNPNSGQSGNSCVRFWIGKSECGNDPQTTFDCNTTMEYTPYCSRFKVYCASSGGVQIRGRNQNPPPPFRVNLLTYNKDSRGNGYGSVSFNSSTYLYGSLVGWQIDVAGSCTIEKQAAEAGTDDIRLGYKASTWKELP